MVSIADIIYTGKRTITFAVAILSFDQIHVSKAYPPISKTGVDNKGVNNMRTERELITEAIQVQDACNLSGVVRSFAKAIEDLNQLPDNKGTAWLNQHRVSRLYTSKILSLTGEPELDDFNIDK